MVQEPVCELVEASEQNEQRSEQSEREENEFFNVLKSTVNANFNKRASILKKAQVEIDQLNSTSSRLQKSLHMEMAKNQQLKQKLENSMKPPIKIKIQNGKTILPNANEC